MGLCSLSRWPGRREGPPSLRVGGSACVHALSLGPAACVCATLTGLSPVVRGWSLRRDLFCDLSCVTCGPVPLNKSCSLLPAARPPSRPRRQRTVRALTRPAASGQWFCAAGRNGVRSFRDASPAWSLRALRADAGCVCVCRRAHTLTVLFILTCVLGYVTLLEETPRTRPTTPRGTRPARQWAQGLHPGALGPCGTSGPSSAWPSLWHHRLAPGRARVQVSFSGRLGVQLLYPGLT